MKSTNTRSPAAAAARRQHLATEISSVEKQFELAHAWAKEAKIEAKAAKKKFKTARREAKKLKKALKTLKLELKALRPPPARRPASPHPRLKPAAKTTLPPTATPSDIPALDNYTAAEPPPIEPAPPAACSTPEA